MHLPVSGHLEQKRRHWNIYLYGLYYMLLKPSIFNIPEIYAWFEFSVTNKSVGPDTCWFCSLAMFSTITQSGHGRYCVRPLQLEVPVFVLDAFISRLKSVLKFHTPWAWWSAIRLCYSSLGDGDWVAT